MSLFEKEALIYQYVQANRSEKDRHGDAASTGTRDTERYLQITVVCLSSLICYPVNLCQFMSVVLIKNRYYYCVALYIHLYFE